MPTKTGKLSVSVQGCSDRKVVLPGQVFEVRWGEQGCEGRVIDRGYADSSTGTRPTGI
jgi:hypothetical protein